MRSQALSTDDVRVRVTALGLGPVTEQDVETAQVMGSRILTFNVRAPAAPISQLANAKGVELVSERVIYHLLTRVGSWMADLLPREEREVHLGSADVLQVGCLGCCWGLRQFRVRLKASQSRAC